MTPCHDSLAQVYRKLRDMQRASDTLFFTTSDAELAKNVSTDIFPVNTASVTCAVAVFRELGLIEAHAMFGPDGLVRSIHVKDTQDKVQLTDSVRYREGMDEREIFHAFPRLGHAQQRLRPAEARLPSHPAHHRRCKGGWK